MKLNLIKKIIFFAAFVFSVAGATRASEISGTMANGGNNGYAWSDRAGWVNFGCANCGISIADSGIAGYAWSPNYGWINMSPANGGVAVAASGALSGYAWGSGLGWINFSGVSINSSGKFVGTASGANVGALAFDCANCSVATDFRPQNFRTAASVPTTAVSVGQAGGGAVIGSMPSAIPSRINAYNVPLQINNDRQSGILTRAFAGGLSVGVDVPRGSVGGHITINAEAVAVDPSTVATAMRIISGALFNITATDDNGNPIHSFAIPIRIALQVPEDLQGRSDIGVYFFDEENQRWERVPNAQFDGNIARFYADHLTLFGILSDSSLPSILAPFFTRPPAIPSAGESIVALEPIGSFAEGEVPKELAESLPEQLFDINLEIESAKIADAKDLIARLIFTSFGRAPTPVDITFDIVNDKGETVYTKKDEITVQTQSVLTEQFADIETSFESGRYTLVATTLYNKNVRDEFKQNFEIVGAEEIKTSLWESAWFWILSTIAISVVFVAAIRKMNKEKNNKRRFK